MDLEAFRVNGEFLIDSTTRNLDFGVNGVYLPMDNADDFEIDKSGKGNNYTKTNWVGTDSDPDVVKDSPSGPGHLVDNQPLVSPLLVLDLQIIVL